MNSLNRVTLIGRLGKDPDVRHMEGGIVKAAFSLATSEKFKDKSGQLVENTTWHNIVCWRWLAETAEKFLRKGSAIYVEGKLSSRSWDDKDGNKKYITEVVADNFIMLDSKRSEEGSQPAGGNYSNPHSESNPVGNAKNYSTESVNSDSSDDLPF